MLEKSMKQYAVILPETIPLEIRGNMRGNARDISNTYSRIVKLGKTDAASPADAIGHFLFREIGVQGLSREAKEIRARTLIRAFGPSAENYVFEVPEKRTYDADGKRLSQEQALALQAMELAMEISEKKNVRPERCHGEALRVVSF